MEGDRQKKVEAGREKLAAYRKKKEKHKHSPRSTSASQSDTSLSTSPPSSEHLPKLRTGDIQSDSSIISEHLNSHSESIENDRSLQEIEISNVPSNCSFFENLSSDENTERISQENKPSPLNFSVVGSNSNSSRAIDETNVDSQSNVQSILNEILKSEEFKSDSERTLHHSNSTDSNDNSFNLFKDFNLNDSLINEYGTKSNRVDEVFNRGGAGESSKLKQLDEIDDTKETFAAGTVDLESLRDINSSAQSTPSLNTSTTDYKILHDEYRNKFVEYQTALKHRDTIIEQLTEALKQSVVNREQLAEQSDFFSKEIDVLKKQLVETSDLLNQKKLDISNSDNKHDSSKSIKDSSIQTDSLPSQILQGVINNSDTTLPIEQTDGVISQTQHFQSSSDSDVGGPILNLDQECLQLEKTLSLSQIELMKEVKDSINACVETQMGEYRKLQQAELHTLEEKLKNEKIGYETQIVKLKELLNDINSDLETKHAREMEELRTYFEKKCAELGKNYSEEVFNQHSRKISESSSCSESLDYVFSGSHPPSGPGGDATHIHINLPRIEHIKATFQKFTKSDCIKLKKDLLNIVEDLNRYDLESISREEHADLLTNLEKCNLQQVFKFDLSRFKLEMQNKYHAELEILREDYMNRIDNLNVDHDNKIRHIESKYMEQIDSLQCDLQEALQNAEVNVHTAVQEVMLAASTSDDTEWPTELLQIRNKFAEKYEREIDQLKQQHHDEVAKLKEEHFKILAGTVERARRKSLKDTTENEAEIVEERDNLLKTTILLRHLIAQLLKYFSECEDELNNTLVDELLKQNIGKNLTELEFELNLNESSFGRFSNISKKRVHFAPKVDEIISAIHDTDTNISLDVRNELDACLERLKSDANAILNLSLTFNQQEPKAQSDGEVRIASLTRQLATESKMKKDLIVELDEARKFAQNLDIDRTNLENQIEDLINKQKILEKDLNLSREKIAELIENGPKELVSKGYGGVENVEHHSLENRIAVLGELQERARSMVLECASTANHPLLELVEELCSEGNRVTEEAKNEHHDLQQQIDAADKKLRATCRFLEEQSAEREQERDEAQKEIACLREQIRERAKDRASCEHISKEVEQLEAQIREMTKVIEESQVKQNEVESEKQEAIEKIFVLRDIIRDLESQVEVKTVGEDELKEIILQLEEIIKQQTATNEELNEQLSSVRNIKEAQNFQQHIDQLEDEIQRLKLHTEFAGSEGVLKQLKSQLNDFEVSIDERTRELEGLLFVISTTNCSSPSEDMSIRDQIRPRTPSVLDECDVPLQQLARLKEKLIKHSRAEDAAVKKIHDLEMEVDSVKHDLNEVQNERDILQDQVSEHLILISSLQMRLDDQRLRAEQVQKQTNTSLEVRIYDLENEIKSLMEVITARDKTIKNLNKTIDETRKKLKDQELELTTKADDQFICQLQEQLEKMQAENVALLKKINDDAQNAQVLPNLVDNILADKNKDIEKLQEKLDKSQTQLNDYLSLNLDREQLKTLSQLSTSERALSDILSLVDRDSPDKLRKVNRTTESLSGSVNIIPHKQTVNETIPVPANIRFEPEISRIEKVGKQNLFYSLDSSLLKPNSTEIHKSTEKRVHFEDTVFNAAIEKLRAEILEQKNEIFEKDELIKEYSERLNILLELEANVIKLQEKLEFTEKALQDASLSFETDLNNMKDVEKCLNVDIAEKKMQLMKKDEQLKLAEEDSVRKDQMYMNLVKEKRELEKTFNELQNEIRRYRDCDDILSNNNKEIASLKSQIAEMGNSFSKVKDLETELCVKQDEISKLKVDFESRNSELKTKLDEFERKLNEKNEITDKLQKDLSNKESQLHTLSQEVDNKSKEVEVLKGNLLQEQKKIATEFEVNIRDMKNLLIDRETEIEILNEDAQRYQDDIAKLEEKLKSFKSTLNQEYELKFSQNLRDIAAKDLEIFKLNVELDDTNRKVYNLQEVLKEKDKVVEQMSEDSKSLRINLQTIQSKMKETGNMLDLKRRLEDEKQLNCVLQEQLHILKSEIADPKPVDMTASIEEITGEVRKQLEYSAQLDSSILSALENSDKEDTNDVDLLRQKIAKEKILRADLNSLNSGLQQNIHELQIKYEEAEDKINNLQSLLTNEKHAQLADAKMLEKFRERLKVALDNENEFGKVLDNEKQIRLHLEEQVTSLKLKLSNFSSGENSKTEVTEYKSLPTLETLELNRLRTHVQVLEGEVTKLQSCIKDLKSEKLKTSATLKYTNDMLEFKNVEIEKLHSHIGGLKEDEENVKQKWISYNAELEQKNRELENSRALIGELESEEREMKEQIEKLNKKFAKAIEREKKLMAEMQRDQLKKTVPDQFLIKMKELNEMVHKHVMENEQMGKVISNLNNEKSVLQNRIMELEELNHVKFPFDDPVERANHLFAKYLRSESYRKALAWQKKYIISLLASYQNHSLPFESATVTPTYGRLCGKSRFRAVVACVMAMIRMQYLVQRWHSGVRGIVRVRNRYHQKMIAMPYTSSLNNSTVAATQFQVGQPVSSQNFPFQIISPVYSQLHTNPVLVPSTSQHHDNSLVQSDAGGSSDQNPWSGQTPPSKDYYCKGRGGFSTKPIISTQSCRDMIQLNMPLILEAKLRYFRIFSDFNVTRDSNVT
ncbi:hypothetical protein RI129_009985 [Pyrocoelia pectoralis]|uniref:Pericentrin/AKAP-450 centrosomal targeting domain-containing protein n=1 Tax=Pyrocoelia pectoralis TaxID=417401 RepID=A0AAN7ZJE1_9COLE